MATKNSFLDRVLDPIGEIVSLVMVVIAPSVVLGQEYNAAVGFGYFCVSGSLLGIFHELRKIRNAIEKRLE